MSAPTYAVVTPARDEEHNLARLAAALVAQAQPPIEWVVVDDGSTDGTAALVRELGAHHPWIRLHSEAQREEGEIEQGRRHGRPLDALRRGITKLSVVPDVVVKVDADVDFEPDYFAKLIGRFADDPLLGIASGACYEPEGGEWVRRTKAEGTVWGASRAYRWECVPDVMALEPSMGWDGLDELKVQLRGMHTQAFTDLPFRHHRPEGGRERSRLHQGAALGRASWYMGYRPSYLVLRSVYRAREEPAALAMMWGYATSALTRSPRCPDAQLVRELRSRQRLGPALRRGAPSS
jgi:glycosyltransferase involved in cell wall biosynthesis